MKLRCLLYVLLCVGGAMSATQNLMETPKKYCGRYLSGMLSQFCLIYNDRRKRNIANECCQNPCSLRYALTHYCKEVNREALERLTKESEVQGDGPATQQSGPVAKPRSRQRSRPKRNKCPCRKRQKLKRNLLRLSGDSPVGQHRLGHVEESEGVPFYVQ